MKLTKILSASIAIIALTYSFNALSESAPTKNECPTDYTCSSSISIFNADAIHKAGFKHFSYVNPDAPKGGAIKFATTGTYDSLNAFIMKGVPAAGISLIYDSLTVSDDEDVYTRHGLLAQNIKMAKDNSAIIFELNPAAKWHDGVSVTADDVIWTFNSLITKGNPFYKHYYDGVKSVEKLDDRTVKFSFKSGDNRELPFIVSELIILPKHYYDGKGARADFSKTTLEAPLGSGAYKVSKIDAGRSISFSRIADYWGKDLPTEVGKNNFDTITYDYYFDDTVAVEALKAGEYDVRQENIARIWATSYNIPEVDTGKIIKKEIPHDQPTGIQAFSYNLRLDKFKDVRVRKALELAFDFEWLNKTIFFNSYTRTRSYFANTTNEAKGLPSPAELKILNEYKDKIPEDIFKKITTEEYQPPKTDGSGNIRNNLVAAKKLLSEAGWNVVDGKLTNEKGEVFEIEFLLNSNTFERVIEPYSKNLKVLGIQAKTRTVDTAQYIKRLDDFDFDIIVRTFGSGSIPGNELLDFYSSKAADVNGSGNLSGIKSEVVDDLIRKVVSAKDENDLTNYARTLDRVLQFNHYVLPQWSITTYRILYWDKFGIPAKTPRISLGLDNWWSKDVEKKLAEEAALKAAEKAKAKK